MRRARRAGLWSGVLALLWVAAPTPLAQELPRQTGSINDYAAVLGGRAQRAGLQALVDRLQADRDVSLVLLLSDRDPFHDLERYGLEIRHAWDLPERRSAFALFLKDEVRWRFRLWLSPDLQAELDPRGLERLQEGVLRLVRRQRLREATLLTAQGLLELLTPGQSPLRGEEGERTGLILFALSVLGLAVGWLAWQRFAWTCPRCGGRLRRARRGGERWRTCPNCGYNR